MTDGHLLNALRLMERQAKQHYEDITSDYPCFQGEMAQECAESLWHAVAEGGWEELLHESYYWLDEERQKRGLK